ncbi:hypothetical protein [Erythrobacter sp. THAF29]|uniref:hypothetical protein n=1 Tax=Erythrobacter sp. THAF29 TaxID=2587851 RepID=UPI0012698309|nr:hypothetical protein [Erythrobacter sp. THAF29]QFT76075.1 hypothetical protein FIU90_00835 [Erythrobacter sp. THAF29]
MFRRLWAACALLSLLLISTPSMAARVSPMIVDLSPSGRGAVARIELSSDSDRTIPYEVLMFRGDISTDGKLTLTPADEDFLVFPTQVLLEGNSRQVFRIQYVGDIELAGSEIFYMSIRQVPVALEDAQASQVQVVVNYNVLVNIVPNNAEAEPAIRSVVASSRLIEASAPEANDEAGEADGSAEENASEVEQAAEVQDGAEGTNGEVAEVTPAEPDAEQPPAVQEIKGLEVLVGNDGNRYFLAGLSKWKIRGKTLSGEDFERELAADKISRFVGAGVVAPGKERRFFLPMTEELDPGTVEIEIEVPRER